MPGPSVSTVRLSFLAVVAVGIATATWHWGRTEERHPASRLMADAVALTRRWCDLVRREKDRLGLEYPREIPCGGMIGSEWTEITTTLGSFDAKVTAANPAFAAVVVKYLTDAGVDSTCRVGVTLSGSFPSLAIATLAAVQSIGARPILISSLGSSSYGANDPSLTWVDIENLLISSGGLKARSTLITYGGEADTGGGISGEGIDFLNAALARNRREVVRFRSWSEALARRMEIMSEGRIDVLINIGGNHVMLGGCRHSERLGNGLLFRPPTCGDPQRGMIERMLEKGIPVIQLLNIRDLAWKNGLPMVPIQSDLADPAVMARRRVPPWLALLSAGLIGLGLWTLRKRRQ